MLLEELKIKKEELNQKVRTLELEITEKLKNLIESNTNISVRLSYLHLKRCSGYGYKKIQNDVGFEYLDIKLIDEEDKDVFGADLTLSCWGNQIFINTGSCGQFTVLGEQRPHDIYQIKKYQLLGWLVSNTDLINEFVNSFDYSIVKEYHDVDIEYQHQKWEDDRRKQEEEKQEILNSIKIGNSYIIDRMSVKVTKITDKRIYLESIIGTTKYYTKDEIISMIKYGRLTKN